MTRATLTWSVIKAMPDRITQTEAPTGMLWVPGGTFRMGSDRFYLARSEQFARLVDETGFRARR